MKIVIMLLAAVCVGLSGLKIHNTGVERLSDPLFLREARANGKHCGLTQGCTEATKPPPECLKCTGGSQDVCISGTGTCTELPTSCGAADECDTIYTDDEFGTPTAVSCNYQSCTTPAEPEPCWKKRCNP